MSVRMSGSTTSVASHTNQEFHEGVDDESERYDFMIEINRSGATATQSSHLQSRTDNSNNDDVAIYDVIYDEEDVEEDRKPAAIPTHNGSTHHLKSEIDETPDDNDTIEFKIPVDDENDSDNESMVSQSQPNNDVPTAEDGRPLSEYEMLRLERMKRNREYLSQLGLENAGATSSGPPAKRQKPKERTKKEWVERRSSISRRTKMQPIRYVGPKSIREMIQTAQSGSGDRQQQKSRLPKGNDSTYLSSQSTTTLTNIDPNMKTLSTTIESTSSTPDDDADVEAPLDGFGIPSKKGHRMEIYIFKEFRRLRSMKRTLLQRAERTQRLAEKEVKYWYNQKLQYDRKMKKKQYIDQYVLEYRKQQDIRTTQKDMIQTMDQKMSLIAQAIKKYDQSILVKERKYENDVKRWKAEEKLRSLDALDWYPKALKNANLKLDTVLLETSPIDPPPPRRSSRCLVDDLVTTKSIPKIKISRTKTVHNEGAIDAMNGTVSRYTDTGMTLEEPTEENDENNGGGAGKATKRQAKNVGGWISPDFANDIDRSWLTSHVPSYNNKQAFDASTYVPQIGDIVLYYITGHRAYLDRYPDVLAKKNRGKKCRVPIWERAAQLRVELQNGSETTQLSDGRWWTNEWIDGLQHSNLGDYPIICKVERTHAEFPPDPYSKVVESNNNDGTIVHFKKPKKFVKGEGKTSMRLAVSLRPLSHVVSPSIHNGCTSETFGLSIPPLFSVITFPCELEPFLVPFVWGYMKSHFISLNQKLSIGNDTSHTVRVDAFVLLSGRDTMRIDDRQNDMESLLSLERTELDDVLQKQDIIIPFREARIVLDIWHHRVKNSNTQKRIENSQLKPSDRFKYLLLSTLPLWQSIFIRKRTYDVHKPRVSAWFLASAEKSRDQTSRCFNRLDETLRLKIDRALQGVMTLDSDAKDLFFDPITEDLAPAYHCAVPVGMSFFTVMQRLRVFIGYESCYYRSVEGILADVSWILECCLLYNSPDSEVVDIATNVVDNTKAILLSVVRDHCRQLKEVRSNDHEIPAMVLQPRPWLNNHGRINGNGTIDRDWLEVKLPAVSTLIDTSVLAVHCDVADIFPFQVRDTIKYSRKLHSRFIAGHCSSLEHYQCHIPHGDYAIENSAFIDSDDWEQGVIVSTHAVFPKILTSDEKDSFTSSAMLQCLGVKLMNDHSPCILFWRPCVINSINPDLLSPCPGCGLTSAFIQLVTNSKVDDSVHKHSVETASNMHSILRCFDLLKRKCLNQTDADDLDPLLVKSTDDRACKVPVTKFGRNSLPSYDKFLDNSPNQPITTESSHHGTRGITLKPKDNDDAISVLLQTGFLPYWISAERGGTINKVLLRKLDIILPMTKLSLEFISLKIKKGFYRHTAAIENDVIEAYVTTVYSLIYEPATRKRTAISVRRISQLVANENYSSKTMDTTVEEQDFARQILRIRRLYATALTCALDVVRAQSVLGLTTSSPPKRNVSELNEEDRIQLAARQKLENLAMILRRENVNVSLNAVTKNVNVKYSMNGDREQLLATQGDSLITVNILFDGQALISNIRQPSQSKSNESLIRLSFGPEDYEHNEELARFLFSRPGRSGPCARCQVYSRTMLVCRVLRKHANLDCGLSTLFSDGLNFVDDLVNVLDPSAFNEIVESTTIINGAKVNIANSQGKEAQQEKVPLVEVGNVVENVENEADPVESFDMATSLSIEAAGLLDAANAYSVRPLRLSRRFIETSFPIDKTDGHYLYCVVCGLGGDLLCCDGCANVVHAKCISLLSLPEGDWFCKQCTTSCSPTISTNALTSSSFCQYDDYGSASFNESKIERIISQIENLRRSRQPQKTKEICTVDVTEISSETVQGDQIVDVSNEGTVGLKDPVRTSLRQRKLQ